MCAFFDLIGCHLETHIPVAIKHGFTELLRAICVGAFTDPEVRSVLIEWNEAINRRCPGFVNRCAVGGFQTIDGSDELRNELGGGATAAPNNLHAHFRDKAHLMRDEIFRGQVIVHGPVDDAG